jgi:hypothetical protein
MPLMGALLFSTFVFATDTLITLPEVLAEPSGQRNGLVLDLIGLACGWGFNLCIGVPVMACIAFTKAFYVAVPMGLLHMGVVRYLAKDDRSASPTRAEPGTVLHSS